MQAGLRPARILNHDPLKSGILDSIKPQHALGDGRIEIDSNIVERSIRPLALGRKNHLFAGSDGGAEHWAVLASLVATCKLNDVDPQAYFADVIARIVQGHPQSDIDRLLPWNHDRKSAMLAA